MSGSLSVLAAPLFDPGAGRIELELPPGLTVAEIVGLSPPPTGIGDTLDAVVAETETAAMEIMQQAERAQAAAGRLTDGSTADSKADLAEVSDAAMSILMACAFQDITGQRIAKVAEALRQLESRLTRFATAVNARDAGGIDPTEVERRMRAELLILNGPQLKGPATAQDEIDALFA